MFRCMLIAGSDRIDGTVPLASCCFARRSDLYIMQFAALQRAGAGPATVAAADPRRRHTWRSD